MKKQDVGMSWHELVKAYFGTPISGNEAYMWFDEIRSKIPSLTLSELEAVVRWASEHRHEDGRVTLKKVRSWVFHHRRLHSNPKADSRKCTCAGGWLYLKRPSGPYAGCAVSVPCTCAKGRRWEEEYYAGHHMQLNQARKWERDDYHAVIDSQHQRHAAAAKVYADDADAIGANSF